MQDEIISLNTKMGLALIVVRSESFKTGYEQVRWGLEFIAQKHKNHQ